MFCRARRSLADVLLSSLLIGESFVETAEEAALEYIEKRVEVRLSRGTLCQKEELFCALCRKRVETDCIRYCVYRKQKQNARSWRPSSLNWKLDRL